MKKSVIAKNTAERQEYLKQMYLNQKFSAETKDFSQKVPALAALFIQIYDEAIKKKTKQKDIDALLTSNAATIGLDLSPSDLKAIAKILESLVP